MTFRQWLTQAIARLGASDSPRRDAEILLGHVTGKARTWILAFDETVLTAEQLAELEALLARRANGEPVAHLVGQREFWSLPLFVSPATLIPRPDTECLVEQALVRLPQTACRIWILAPAPALSPWRWPASGRTARLLPLILCLTPRRSPRAMPPISLSTT